MGALIVKYIMTGFLFTMIGALVMALICKMGKSDDDE